MLHKHNQSKCMPLDVPLSTVETVVTSVNGGDRSSSCCSLERKHVESRLTLRRRQNWRRAGARTKKSVRGRVEKEDRWKREENKQSEWAGKREEKV